MSPFTFEPGFHKGQKVIFIRFEKDRNLISSVKQLIGSRWSQTLQCWYVPDADEYRKKFNLEKDYFEDTNLDYISRNNQLALKKFIEKILLMGL